MVQKLKKEETMNKFIIAGCLILLMATFVFGIDESHAFGSYGNDVNAFCTASNPYTGDCTLCHVQDKAAPTTAKSKYQANDLCYFCPTDPVCAPPPPPPPPPPACTDADGDGFFKEGGSCGTVDCNDSNASINPEATESCTDGIDNNCNGLTDAQDPASVGCPAPPPPTATCTDNDNDGFSKEGGSCGTVDCNDSNASINPEATESCTDGIDNNCNGLTDANDSACGTPQASMPDITVTDPMSPDSDMMMHFGDLGMGKMSSQTITVTNSGNAALIMGTIAQSDPVQGPFGISVDGCSGTTLQPGGSCTVTLWYSPQTEGSFSDAFDIPSNDPDENPVIVSVSGNGIASTANSAPSIPELLYPSNGQTEVDTELTFKWKESGDPDGDALTYSLLYCTNADFTGCDPIQLAAHSPENNDTDAPDAGAYGAGLLFASVVAGGISGRRKIKLLLMASLLISGMSLISCGGGGGSIGSGSAPGEISRSVELQGSTTYYWKVTAEDGKGGSAESEVRTFTTK
jgi:hypothetical protein